MKAKPEPREPYKLRSPRKFIGSYRPRIEAKEKASGNVRYIDDITIKSRFPDLLYAKVLRSPYAHARIRNLDISLALKLPGVVDILTYKNPEVASLRPTNAMLSRGASGIRGSTLIVNLPGSERAAVETAQPRKERIVRNRRPRRRGLVRPRSIRKDDLRQS